MALLILFLFLGVLLPSICATPVQGGGNGRCGKIAKRKAWHTFKDMEKREYIDAELCLMSKPASQQLATAVTRFDELQAVHQIVTFHTHFVGAFLPWHRLFLLAHETFLRDECGYKGYQPYWHEPMDAGHFMDSVVLDPVLGFGGNGTGPGRCIEDGPFKDYTNHLGPFFSNTDHCLFRFVNETMTNRSSQYFVDQCMAQTNYDAARQCIEGRPHEGGHGGMGGQMLDPINSPGDPLFYLHHTWLDKLWWNWQSLDLENRLTDISGVNVMPQSWIEQFPPMPADWWQSPYPLPGDPGNETTLNHVLDVLGVLPNMTIAEVMDIRVEPFCYEYVEP